MEIVDIGGKDGICPKCHIGLSAEEKRRRMPICTKCITELANIVKNGIDTDGLEEFSDDVSNFTDFVSSSARLMGLDDIVVIQVCFNVYMDGVREMADGNPTMARKIFNDARRFIDIELERLEDVGEGDLSKNDDGRMRDIFEKMMGGVNKMMKDYHEANGENDIVNGREDDIVNGREDDIVNGREDDINNEKVDNEPNKDDAEKEIKKESKSGSKRIMVD